MQKLSKKPLAYFQQILDNPNETEQNKVAATMFISYEHAFMEIYAGRRLIENSFLDCLVDLSQAITELAKKNGDNKPC